MTGPSNFRHFSSQISPGLAAYLGESNSESDNEINVIVTLKKGQRPEFDHAIQRMKSLGIHIRRTFNLTFTVAATSPKAQLIDFLQEFPETFAELDTPGEIER